MNSVAAGGFTASMILTGVDASWGTISPVTFFLAGFWFLVFWLTLPSGCECKK